LGAGIQLPSEGIDAAVSLADELYRRRAEGNVGLRLLATLDSCQGAADSYEIQWRVSRAMFLDGQGVKREGAKHGGVERGTVKGDALKRDALKRDALRFHEAGIAHGRKAARLNPYGVEGHFWLGVNIALLGEHANALRAVVAVLQARAELRRAASICPEYHGAGPLRVLGRLEHKAPWFLGGSMKRSRAYYDRALELASGNCVTLMYAAELAIDAGETGRASDMLRRIVELPLDPAWEFEQQRDKSAAMAMLARLT
jgi:tetratricopeptide (TPR) repeat protein